MKNQDEKYNKLRRQKINVMLNEEERKIIKEKAIKYGFGDCLAEYIRAACIYENIYIEDVHGKEKVCNKVSEYIKELREILNAQRKLMKNVFLTKDDIDKIKNQNQQIIEKIGRLSRIIISSLSVVSEKKIQQRINMIEKYDSDKLIPKIQIAGEWGLVLRPSNLYHPNEPAIYIVFLPEYYDEIEINNFDPDKFKEKIDNYRHIAMKKELYISIYHFNDKLRYGIVMPFVDKESATKYAEEMEADYVYDLYSQQVEMDGDIYSSNS